VEGYAGARKCHYVPDVEERHRSGLDRGVPQAQEVDYRYHLGGVGMEAYSNSSDLKVAGELVRWVVQGLTSLFFVVV
jgi:hypothetical protein